MYIHALKCHIQVKWKEDWLCGSKIVWIVHPVVFLVLKSVEITDSPLYLIPIALPLLMIMVFFELDIERMYISEKLEKHHNHKKRKSYRYKVKWTVSDLNRF
jgi:hypothetical protein